MFGCLILHCVIGVGFIIVAVVRWRRHPRVSRLTVLGLVTLGVNPVAQFSVFWVLQSVWGYQFEDVFPILKIVHGIFYLVGMALILSAIFVSRSQRLRLARYDDPHLPLPEELTRPAPSPGSETAFREGKLGG
jgi:hypothetical protein